LKARFITPILNVSSLADSIVWFERLGWSRQWDWGDPPAFGCVSAGDFNIFLCEGGQGGRGKGSNKKTFGPNKEEEADKGVWMSIWVDDVDEIYAHCLHNDIEVTLPPEDMPWSVREMHVRHPDGHVFRITKTIKT